MFYKQVFVRDRFTVISMLVVTLHISTNCADYHHCYCSSPPHSILHLLPLEHISLQWWATISVCNFTTGIRILVLENRILSKWFSATILRIFTVVHTLSLSSNFRYISSILQILLAYLLLTNMRLPTVPKMEKHICGKKIEQKNFRFDWF